MKLLKLLRSLGKVHKIKQHGNGHIYVVTYKSKRKTAHIQVSVFKG